MARGYQTGMVGFGLDLSSRRAPSATDSADAQMSLGTTLETDDGRQFQYNNVRAAIAIGQLVTVLNPDDADVDAAASDNTLTGTGDFTAAEFDENVADRREYYTFINAGTALGQCRRIISNTANVLTLDTAWTTALDTTSDFVTFGPYHVALTVNASSAVFGVAISAVSDAGNAWFQTDGFCPQVRCVGTTDACVVGRGVFPSATAGAGRGPTTAGVTAADAELKFGVALAPWAAADTAGQGVPVKLRCD